MNEPHYHDNSVLNKIKMADDWKIGSLVKFSLVRFKAKIARVRWTRILLYWTMEKSKISIHWFGYLLNYGNLKDTFYEWKTF